MKIVDIKATPLALRFKEPYYWAGRVDLGAVVILLEVTGPDGLTGVGEVIAPWPPKATLSMIEGLIPEIIGQPLNIDGIVTRARLLAGLHRTPRSSALVTSGLDMALWDLMGKVLNQPVYTLMGGAVNLDVDYFAFPQGITPKDLAEASADAAMRNYEVIYVKIGHNTQTDIAIASAVRKSIGDKKLRLDANGAWDPVTAVNMIQRLAEFEPEFIEQPTPPRSIAALKQVHDSTTIPIAADQSVFTMDEVYEICLRHAADLLVFSPHETGGLSSFKKAAGIAEAAGLKVCLHGQWTSGISDAAQHHAALNTPNISTGNQIMHQLLVEDLISSPDLTPHNGRLGLWSGPGFGFELNRDAVGRAAEYYINHGQNLKMVNSSKMQT